MIMSNKQYIILLSIFSTFFVSPSSYACGINSYIGSICPVAITYCPKGTLEADGRLLKIADHRTLFSLMENQYGGNGKTHFALPDLRGQSIGARSGRKSISIKYCVVIQGIFPPKN